MALYEIRNVGNVAVYCRSRTYGIDQLHGQSLIGILLFYGIGFGWGASVGLGTTELIACGVFVVELLCSLAWLRYFRYGPLEWIWRMLTYGEYLKIKKEI